MLDAQVKRGLLEMCVLSALSRGEAHGYRIIKELAACVEISESTLYPILRRLEASGALSVRSVEHNGRLRKIYAITDVGRKTLAQQSADLGEIIAICNYIQEGVNP